MLCVNQYPPSFVDACRDQIATTLAAYRALVAQAGEAGGSSKHEATIRNFEPRYFADALLALEARFVHRARGKEGKDGNPLNEVRMVCDALVHHDGVLTADKTIRYDPKRSVLGIALGERVLVDESGFTRLADAFLDEIGRRYA